MWGRLIGRQTDRQTDLHKVGKKSFWKFSWNSSWKSSRKAVKKSSNLKKSVVDAYLLFKFDFREDFQEDFFQLNRAPDLCQMQISRSGQRKLPNNIDNVCTVRIWEWGERGCHCIGRLWILSSVSSELCLQVLPSPSASSPLSSVSVRVRWGPASGLFNETCECLLSVWMWKWDTGTWDWLLVSAGCLNHFSFTVNLVRLNFATWLGWGLQIKISTTLSLSINIGLVVVVVASRAQLNSYEKSIRRRSSLPLPLFRSLLSYLITFPSAIRALWGDELGESIHTRYYLVQIWGSWSRRQFGIFDSKVSTNRKIEVFYRLYKSNLYPLSYEVWKLLCSKIMWVSSQNLEVSWQVPARHTFWGSLPHYRFAYLNPQFC